MKTAQHWPLEGALLGSEHSPHMLLWEPGGAGDWVGQKPARGIVFSVEMVLRPRQGV